MSPGDIAALIQSNEVAFRVHFEGPAPPPAGRYWRGQVFENFDGRTWKRGWTQARPLQSDAVRYECTPVRYALPLERSAQSRVGKASVIRCRSRWSPSQSKKNILKTN